MAPLTGRARLPPSPAGGRLASLRQAACGPSCTPQRLALARPRAWASCWDCHPIPGTHAIRVAVARANRNDRNTILLLSRPRQRDLLRSGIE